jgi:hypothetical protein
MRVLRTLGLSVLLALLPFGVAIGASAANPTVHHHELLQHKLLPDAECIELTKHVGCYLDTTLDYESSAGPSPLIQPAAAYDACSSWNYYQTYYNYWNVALAQTQMSMGGCWFWGGSAAISWGPQCRSYTIYPGGVVGGSGIDNCYGVNEGNYSYGQDNWYVYPYTAPWIHRTAVLVGYFDDYGDHWYTTCEAC